MLSSAQLAKKFSFTISRQRRSQSARHVLLGKTAQVFICFVVLAALPYCVPRLDRYRVLMPSGVINLLQRPSQPVAASTPVSMPGSNRAAVVVRTQVETKIEAKPGEIEDASGKALDHF